MTTYTAIPDADIDTDSPLTESLFTLIRDNPIAITEGSTGAPKIQTAALEQAGGSEAVTTATIRQNAVTQNEINASAVGRSECKTGTQSLSGVLATSSTTDIVLHAYSFFPMIHSTDQQSVQLSGHNADGASPDNARFSFYNSSATGASYDVDYRYIGV